MFWCSVAIDIVFQELEPILLSFLLFLVQLVYWITNYCYFLLVNCYYIVCMTKANFVFILRPIKTSYSYSNYDNLLSFAYRDGGLLGGIKISIHKYFNITLLKMYLFWESLMIGLNFDHHFFASDKNDLHLMIANFLWHCLIVFSICF